MFLFSQPPPLRISFTSILILVPLLEVNDGRFDAEVVAAVFAGERIDGVGPQFPAARGFRHGFLNRALEHNLVDADRRVDHEGGHAGVLADGTLVLGRHIDIRGDHVQRLRGLRVGQLGSERAAHGFAHVGRQVGGGLGDEFDEAFGEELHFDQF